MPSKHSILPLILLSVSAITFQIAAVPTGRDVPSVGPDGELGLLKRWRDTVGTATRVSARGLARRLTAIITSRSGPLPSVYRTVITSNITSEPCNTRPGQKCEVAIDGFGTVGEVHYVFNKTRTNFQGRSTQVMVACRCLSEECGVAVLMRPVNITRTRKDGTKVETGRRTCLYEKVNGNFTDCHSELLRVSYRQKNSRPNYLHLHDFNYSVIDAFWNATGQRGWTRACDENEIKALPVIKLADLEKAARAGTGFNYKHIKSPNPKSQCRPHPGAQYYRTEEADEGTCTEIYDHAAAAAAYTGTQQDTIATGTRVSTMQDEPPILLGDTEIALICSAAGLGLLFVWSRFVKRLKPEDNSWKHLCFSVVAQAIMLYVLETLPMHTALQSETRAKKWSTILAFADGTLMLAKEQLDPHGSAVGSVLILTAVVGEVSYKYTKVVKIIAITVFFDLAALAIIALTVFRKVRFITTVRRDEMYGTGDKNGISALAEAGAIWRWRNGIQEDRESRLLRRQRGISSVESSASSSELSNECSLLKKKSVLSWVTSNPDAGDVDLGGMSSTNFAHMIDYMKETSAQPRDEFGGNGR